MSRKENEIRYRETLITAAEHVFGRMGFDSASIDIITNEAGITRRTLYRYFKNKEELYFAVVHNIYDKLLSHISRGYQSEKTGFLKLCSASKQLAQLCKSNPQMLKIISWQGQVKKKALQDSFYQGELMKLNQQLFEETACVIADGVSDGSIKPGINPRKIAFSLVFIMTGYYCLMASTGDNFISYFSLLEEDFNDISMDLILGSLKNDPA
ncbi:TetR family transcriptional regulator [Anaerocolumna sedimenticola]|uniref:TetR family transcriptional regulator n=1 Tax=Anaerocolumna sedimenticola TaxID=2696063 RepID=A0A6P1TVG3_9FIRM|nr:TetR/AcrR family transcriptional regulator [Anaerocolumna sedimenticola]QHQ63415.1 TetR family transcriptional regulator [Anaerocolumna sedimenticola]